MTDQATVRKQLTVAWKACEQDYNSHAINSERSLQAVFYFHLRRRFSKHLNMTVFVEPRFVLTSGSSGSVAFPDLVVCDKTCIVAVVELKYQPRKVMTTANDLRKLISFSECCSGISLTNNRSRGITTEPNTYTLSDDALFVWAGVHRGAARGAGGGFRIDPQVAASTQEFRSRFLQLHADTSVSQGTRFVPRLDV